MLIEYAQFVQSIFPSINPALAKQLISQARLEGFVNQEYFANQLGNKLCQGDVVEGIEWPIQREDGRYGRRRRPGLLLSHSCDVDNAVWLVFASCVPFDRSLGNANEIRKQRVTELYYMSPHGIRPDLVVDLSQVQSLRAERVLCGIAEGTLARVDSFTHIGYWHFLAKLAIHLMRPQPGDEVRYACVPAPLERVAYATSAVTNLVRYAILGRSG